MYEDFTVRQFGNAWFKGDRTVMSEDVFSVVKNEYVDTSGQYDLEEFEKTCYIQYLVNRKNSISIWFGLQTKFLEEFEIPFLPQLDFLKRFGHTITWNDKEGFLKQLEKVEKKECKYISQLETSIKELNNIREKKLKQTRGEKPKEITHDGFISMIISLRKCGYEIRQDETTVQELAHCIKKQLEEASKSTVKK